LTRITLVWLPRSYLRVALHWRSASRQRVLIHYKIDLAAAAASELPCGDLLLQPQIVKDPEGQGTRPRLFWLLVALNLTHGFRDQAGDISIIERPITSRYSRLKVLGDSMRMERVHEAISLVMMQAVQSNGHGRDVHWGFDWWLATG
jgi:hypothetical protein